MNHADLSRYLDQASNLSSEAVAGETEDRVLVDKYVERGGLDKYYYRQVTKTVPKLKDRLDENGEPVYDTEEGPTYGKPLQDFVYDEEGKQVFEDVLDENGNPVMERGPRYEDVRIPEGGEVMPHYEMPDGTLIPLAVPTSISPAFKTDLRKKLENRQTFLGNVHNTNKHSELGVGLERSKESGAEYEYLKNIFNAIEDREQSPEVFAARRHKEAGDMRKARGEAQKTESTRLQSLSGLPNETLQKMQGLMDLYHNTALEHEDEDTYDFKVPENVRDYIKENLPIFSDVHSDHSKAHLDAFLTNFYRNWKREWNSAYRKEFDRILSDPTHETDLANQVAKAVQTARQKNRELPEKEREPDSLDAKWVRDLRDKVRRTLVEQADPSAFTKLRKDVGLNIIDNLLSEDNAKFTEVSIAQTVGGRTHYLPPEPRGGTHIPVSVGGIWKEDLIPTIATLALFPIERFSGPGATSLSADASYTDDTGTPIPISTAWFWMREHAPYFEAIARHRGVSIEEAINDMLHEDTGKINVTRIGEWLHSNGFIGNRGGIAAKFWTAGLVEPFKEASNTLPAELVANPELRPVRTSKADLARVAVANFRTFNEEEEKTLQETGGIADFRYLPGENYLEDASKLPEMR